MTARPGPVPALAAAAALALGGCWSQPVAVETRSVAPQTPEGIRRTQPGAAGPPPVAVAWPPAGTDEHAFRPRVPAQRTLPGGARVLAADVPVQTAVADSTALLRLSFPTGSAGAHPGLAELAAWTVAEMPDARNGRPSLRQRIADLAGDLDVRAGADHVDFDLEVPVALWRTALDALLHALRTPASSEDQIERIRTLLLHTRRAELSIVGLENALRMLRPGALEPEHLLAEIQSRSPQDVMLFQRLGFGPAGAVLTARLPGTPAAEALDQLAEALAPWAGSLAAPPDPAGSTTDPAPAGSTSQPAAPGRGIHWARSDRDRCRFALVFPLPPLDAPGSLETATALGCLTLDGAGGRLGRALRELGTPEPVLDTHTRGSRGERHLVLVGEGPPELAVRTWEALQLASRELQRDPPDADEVRIAAARLRLRLLAEHADPQSWLDHASDRALRGLEPLDPSPLLTRLSSPSTLTLDAAVADLGSRATLVVVGARPRESSQHAIHDLPDAFAEPSRTTVPIETAAQIEAAEAHLASAVRAVGGTAALRTLDGFAAELVRRTADGAAVREKLWFRAPDRLRRIRRFLATTIETVVGPGHALERAADKRMPLTPDEARTALDRAARHPLLLLAGHARGEIRFRQTSTRTEDGREMAVLERVDPTRERLRLWIDVASGLVRVVETRERRADLGDRVHIAERFDDYRPVGAVRWPFRCVTTVDEGAQRVTVVYEEVVLGAPAPATLITGGPLTLK